MDASRVFLLSPASCSGRRAQLLLNERATFAMALRIRSAEGAPLGEVFSFLSGLYFRGKLTYARRFACPPAGLHGAWVITTSRGLLPSDTMIHLNDLHEFAEVPIDSEEPRYRAPLERDARSLARRLGPKCEAVLLGSIATNKYVQVLSEAFGQRLLFPSDFVGRGDMSRGGLLLRCADEDRELDYIPVTGAVRRGSRPAKLPRRA